MLPVDNETPEPTRSESCEQSSLASEGEQPMSASRLKMKPEDYLNNSLESSDDESFFQGKGYRLIDLKKLSSRLSEAYMCEKR